MDLFLQVDTYYVLAPVYPEMDLFLQVYTYYVLAPVYPEMDLFLQVYTYYVLASVYPEMDLFFTSRHVLHSRIGLSRNGLVFTSTRITLWHMFCGYPTMSLTCGWLKKMSVQTLGLTPLVGRSIKVLPAGKEKRVHPAVSI